MFSLLFKGFAGGRSMNKITDENRQAGIGALYLGLNNLNLNFR